MNSATIRVGFGYDVHAFAAGRPLMLGGVHIPDCEGLAGHSDADVLIHAVMDALLGAAGLPDIGHQFPNTDRRWLGADSRELLRHVRALIAAEGWKIGNLDTSLVAERPRVAPHIPLMRERIAADLEVAPGAVGIKATTNERLGFVGRGEGIAAMAVALLHGP